MSVKIDIISGFLGAGKTTLINKLLKGNVLGENIAMIENEYGDIDIDSGRIEDTAIEIKSIAAGCICCSLSGEFDQALKGLIDTYNPSRIIIEPTGVGKLSDIINLINYVKLEKDIDLNMIITIVDVLEYEDFIDIFGIFFTDQIEYANTIMISKSQLSSKASLDNVIISLRELNSHAAIVSRPWDDLSPKEILDIAEAENYDINLDSDHDHHEDKQFEYWSKKTTEKYSVEELEIILDKLKSASFGKVVRAKGILQNEETGLSFDFSPSSSNIESINPQELGQIVVIGEDLNKEELNNLWK